MRTFVFDILLPKSNTLWCLITMAVRCQLDLLFSTQTCRVFESDLLSFDSVLPIYWVSSSHFLVSPSVLWLRPSRFLSWIFSLLTQSFPFIKSVLPIFDLNLPFFDSVLLGFFESDLLYFDSVLLIYWVSPSHFWVVPSVFWVSPSRFFELDFFYFDSILPIYWVHPSYFFHYVLPAFARSTFWFNPHAYCWQS